MVEGVESTGQLALLAEWGCDLYQGFLGAGRADAGGADPLRRRRGDPKPPKVSVKAFVSAVAARRSAVLRSGAEDQHADIGIGIGSGAAASLVAACKKAAGRRGPFSQAALDRALADPARKDQRDAADARRKPGPLIALAGVKPGRQGLRPDSGQRLLDAHLQQDRRARRQGLCGLAAGLCAHRDGQCRRPAKAVGGQILRQYRHARFSRATTLTAPEPLDVVWTSQNYHDYPDEFMGKGDPSSLDKDVFKILKPGGTFMIIDHMAKPGAAWPTPTRCTGSTRRPCARRRRRRASASPARARCSNNPADPLDIPVFDKSDPRPHQPVRLQVREALGGLELAPARPCHRARAASPVRARAIRIPCALAA